MKKIYIVLIIFLTTGTCWSDVLIVLNKNVVDTIITRENIQDIFLGKKVQWSDNTKIHIATSQNADLHSAFLRDFIKRSPNQYKDYWRRMVFTGKGKTPRKFESVDVLIKYVAKTKGAIGYINKDVTAVNVNTIAVQ